MGGEKADMVFTDPPYGKNLNTDYTDMPETRIASKTYKSIEGDDKDFDASPFLTLFSYCKEQFWWGGDYYYQTLPPFGSWLVWDKRNENSDGLVGNHFELCWSKTPHRRRMIRVHWAGVNARNQGMERSHPSEKAIKVLTEIINDYSKANTIILDPFGGSGSTLIACEKLDRRCYMMEIDEHYCDIIIQRWQNYTGKEAIKIDERARKSKAALAAAG